MHSLVIYKFSKAFWKTHTVTPFRFRGKDDDWRCRLQWERDAPVVFPDVDPEKWEKYVQILRDLGCEVELISSDNNPLNPEPEKV